MTLVPSATVKNAVSVQLCGEVFACKLVERALRGEESLYMGDHRATASSDGGPRNANAAERVGFPHLADALRQIPERQ